MSTFTAVGPALAIDGPLPVAPPHSLLNTEGVAIEGEGRWMNGINVWGFPCDTPSTWEPCSDGTFRQKSSDVEMPITRFDAITAYLPITCSTISVGGGDRAEDFADRARTAFRAKISFAAEFALAQGVEGSSNPFLADANVTVLGGGAVTPEVALSLLEDAIGSTGSGGIIHATPSVIAAWQTFFVSGKEENMLLTANGTRVVSGGGYIGADSPAAGQAWAFATGPVHVFLGDDNLNPGRVSEALDRSDNVVTYRAEQTILPYWDTCLQAGVLIDYVP